jgi:DNA-directed RNA polymerase subunit RPC12/RpoP
MNADFTYFFKVIIDGYYEVVCSRCEMELAADPTIRLIYDGPVSGPAVRCINCGLRWSEPAEEAGEPGPATE